MRKQNIGPSYYLKPDVKEISSAMPACIHGIVTKWSAASQLSGDLDKMI